MLQSPSYCIFELNLLKSKLWSSKPFQNASVPNKNGVGQFRKFGHKIDCYTNVPQEITK